MVPEGDVRRKRCLEVILHTFVFIEDQVIEIQSAQGFASFFELCSTLFAMVTFQLPHHILHKWTNNVNTRSMEEKGAL